MEDERPCLGSAEAAVEGDQLLERAALVEIRVIEAVDQDVGGLRESVRTEEMPRRVRRVGRKRVLPLDPAVFERMNPPRPERERPEDGRADEYEADVGVLAKRRDQLRVPFLDLFERQSPRRVHEVDEP